MTKNIKKSVLLLFLFAVIGCSPSQSNNQVDIKHPLMGWWKNNDGITLIFHDDPINNAFGGITINHTNVKDFDLIGDSQIKVIHPGHDDLVFYVDYQIEGDTLILNNYESWLGETSPEFQKIHR